MSTCESCGNDYAKPFTVLMNDKKYIFDSFECAIAKLAPTCQHCQCKVIGHGVETQSKIYCCDHCVRSSAMTTKYGAKAQTEVKKEMHRFKKGTAHSGPKHKKVKSREQAIAIGLSKAREKGAKVPKKRAA